MDNSTYFIRQKVREKGFARKLIEPKMVTAADLDRVSGSEEPAIILEKDINATAMTVPFRGRAETRYWERENPIVLFDKIEVPRYSKSKFELISAKTPYTKILERRFVQYAQRVEDETIINSFNKIITDAEAKKPGSQLQKVSGGLTKENISILIKMLTRLRMVPTDPGEGKPKFLMSQTLKADLINLGMIDIGDKSVSKNWEQGTLGVDSLFGIPVVTTVKNDLVKDNEMYMIAPQDFDKNKQRVSALAKTMLDNVNQSGDAPDTVLEQTGKAQNLNDHWKQRVVEEFNILSFLQKLQDGTQQEHFQVAQPVIDECKQWLHIDWDTPQSEQKASEKIEKKASYDNQYMSTESLISANAFEYGEIDRFDFNTISGDRFDDTIELEKVAFEKRQMFQELQDEELIKEANYHIGKEENYLINELVKIANVSPGFTKSIIHDLYKKGHQSYAEDIMVESKYKPDEIMSSSIYDDVAPYERCKKSFY